MVVRRRLPTVTERSIADGTMLVFVLGWWWTARGLPAFVMPGPFDVATTLLQFLVDPDLLWHVGVSFVRVGGAVIAAMALAILIAVAARRSPVFLAIVERRVLVILNSFPSVGWAILGVIWFQISNLTVIFIQVMIVLPFCLINALQGLRELDLDLDELGLSLTRSRHRRFLKMTLPLVAPFVLAGLRVSYGICWKIALVSELFGATSGLGYLLMQAQSSANGAMVFACCLVIVIVFGLVDRLALRPLAAAYSRNQGGLS